MEDAFVSLDADHLGHLLVVISKYHDLINEQGETAEIAFMDFGVEKYQIGYLQSRAELGLLTQEDINVIEEWESALE